MDNRVRGQESFFPTASVNLFFLIPFFQKKYRRQAQSKNIDCAKKSIKTAVSSISYGMVGFGKESSTADSNRIAVLIV